MALPLLSQPIWRAMLALGLTRQRLTCTDLYDRNETREEQFHELVSRCLIKYRYIPSGFELTHGCPKKDQWPMWQVVLTAPGQTAARLVVHYATILGETRFKSRVVKALLKYGTDSYGVARPLGKNGRKEIAAGDVPGSLLVTVDDLTVLEQWGWMQASAVPKWRRRAAEGSSPGLNEIDDSDYQDMDLARALREDPDNARVRVVQSAADGRYTSSVNV